MKVMEDNDVDFGRRYTLLETATVVGYLKCQDLKRRFMILDKSVDGYLRHIAHKRESR